MTKLIQESQNIIEKCLMHFKSPVIACSFGKDSIVMLHILIKRMNLTLPVIFWRESFFPKKYSYANRIIEDWDLQTIDYPSAHSAVIKKNGVMEIFNYHTMGGKFMILPTGVCAPEPGEKQLCGLKDLLEKPKGAYQFPYDLIFMGHKNSDVDPCHGAVPLHVDINISRNAAATAYPIKNWNDSDIWQYIEENDVPIHHDRYEKVDGAWRERDSKVLNPDYFPACTSCIDPDSPRAVYCPKMGCMVPNVADQYMAPDFKFNYTGV